MAAKDQDNKKDVAELYSTVSHLVQNPIGLETIEKLDPKPGDTVLDLGCGTGYLSSVLAGKVDTEGRVVAVDPDAERIKVAKEEYCDVTNLVFYEGNSNEFPEVGSGCYDAVFSNFVLHWIADKEKMFRTVYDSLKPGGKLTFRFTLKFSLIEDAIRILTPEMLPVLHNICYFEPEVSVKEYCLKSGFKILQSNEYVETTLFESKDEFLKFCCATVYGLLDLNSVAEDKKQEFRPPLDDLGRVVYQREHAILIAIKE